MKTTGKPSAGNSALVQGLLAKKLTLEAQLDAVNKVLESEGYNVAPRHVWEASSPITKAEAIRKVLTKAKKPVHVKELIQGMESEGYTFNTANKANALNTLLYGKKLDWLQRTDEGFSIKR